MRYIKHSRRASSASSAMPMTTMTSMSGSSTPLPESPSSSRAHSVAPQPNGTPIPIPNKISASYTEIHELAAEKCALAERLIEIITRTRAKLDVDIAKVRLLQGDPPELVAAQASATANMKPAGLVALSSVPLTPVGSIAAEPFGAPGRNPALAISESLRIALANQPLVEGSGGRGAGSGAASGTTTPTGTSGHATKSESRCVFAALPDSHNFDQRTSYDDNHLYQDLSSRIAYQASLYFSCSHRSCSSCPTQVAFVTSDPSSTTS